MHVLHQGSDTEEHAGSSLVRARHPRGESRDAALEREIREHAHHEPCRSLPLLLVGDRHGDLGGLGPRCPADEAALAEEHVVLRGARPHQEQTDVVTLVDRVDERLELATGEAARPGEEALVAGLLGECLEPMGEGLAIRRDDAAHRDLEAVVEDAVSQEWRSPRHRHGLAFAMGLVHLPIVAPGDPRTDMTIGHHPHVVAEAQSAGLPTLFLEFGLLLIGLGLLARLANRLGISAVPLYLIAGLAFGDGGLVGIPASDDFIRTVAELGVVVLLLLLGLEYSGTELVGHARRQLRAGAADLLLNAIPGAVLALALGWGIVGAVALGGATYISSSGIVSQLLRDLRWRRNPETAPVVSVLVIEDLVMAPYLPILTVLLTGASAVSGLITVGSALLVVAIVIAVSMRGTRGLHRIIDPRDPAGLLLLTFGAAIAAAGLAGIVDFSPAVAAFLVGLLLTGEVADVARRRLDPLRDMLAAVFFAYFGLITDPADMLRVLLPALLLAFVTITTKFLTGWIASSPGRPTTAGRLRAGALLSARGEFSVVIAGLVVASDALPDDFGPLVATYVLITATAAPILARYVERVGWWWDSRPRHTTHAG